MKKDLDAVAELASDGLREIEFAAQISALDISDVDEFVTFAVVLYTRYFDPDSVTPNPEAPNCFVLCRDFKGFIPTIVIDDLRDSMDREYSCSTRINYQTGQIWTTLLNTVTISQSMDFRRFPFDNQFLILDFISTDSKLREWKSDFEMLGFPALKPGEEGDVNKEEAIFAVLGAPDHWVMANLEATFYQEPAGAKKFFQSSCKVVCFAQRKPLFYFITYCIIVYFIVGTNVCVVAIAPDEAGDRNSITTTLLLTLVAFKYVITQGVTRVSYLTIMDYYVLTSFMFILIAVLENIAVSSLGIDFAKGKDIEIDEKAIRIADFRFHLFYIIAWTGFNLLVLFVCWNPWILRRPVKKMKAEIREKEKMNVMRTKAVTVTRNEEVNQPYEVTINSQI